MDVEIAIGKVVYTFIVWIALLNSRDLDTWDENMLKEKFYILLSYGWLDNHEPKTVSAIGLNDLTYFTFEWFIKYVKKHIICLLKS